MYSFAALTDTDILERLTEPKTFARGRAYFRDDMVRSIKSTNNPPMLTGIVDGSGRQRYTVSITSGTDERSFIGRCTCPVGENCKHVVAVLLEARHRARLTQTDAAASKAADGPARSASAAEQVDPAVQAWIDQVARFDRPDDYSDGTNHRLFYVFAPLPAPGGIGVTPTSVRVSKDGRPVDAGNPVDPEIGSKSNAPKYLRGVDLLRLREISSLPRTPMKTSRLDETIVLPLITGLLETGRVRWSSVDGPSLSLGPSLAGSIVWQPADNGIMRPVPILDPAAADADESEPPLLFAGEPPLWVQPKTGLIGVVETGLPPSLVRLILSAPPLSHRQAEAAAARMRSTSPTLARFAPPALPPAETIEQKPIPVLDLTVATERNFASFLGFRPEPVPVLRLRFQYGPFIIDGGLSDPNPMRVHQGRPYEIHRRPSDEWAILGRLRSSGFRPIASVAAVSISDPYVLGRQSVHDWILALVDLIPALEAEGAVVRRLPDFPLNILVPDAPVEVTVRESSGVDWFELDIGTKVGDERVDLAAPLAVIISTLDPQDLLGTLESPDGRLVTTLPDGRLIALESNRVRPFVEMLLDLYGGTDVSVNEPLRLSRYDLAALGGLEGKGTVEWAGGEGLRTLGRLLAAGDGYPDVPLPQTFNATLRPYQRRGLAWLSAMAAAGFGAVLADDMGLGKTLQALALIAAERAAGRLDGPVLVIAPTSLMANWAHEAARFVPDLKVVVLQGSDRASRFDAIDAADLVLSTYPLVVRDKDVLGARTWAMMILDEAQMVKNPSAATTRLIRDLKARHRIALSGTPVENNLAELWSLFHIVAPGLLGDRTSFARRFRMPIEKKGDRTAAGILARRVKPFLMRRTKGEVAADLPEKTEIVERVTLDPGQREVYEAVRLAMNETVRAALADKGFARSRIVILDALLKLRQACCDPRLVKSAGARAASARSAKLERLIEMLSDLLAEGRRVLVFSQFTSMLDLIAPRLETAGIAYSRLTGETKDRAAVVAAFQAGTVPVFLISLKAGGVGLNLTAADTVILYDPWWNPAVEAQAIDRAHRIGQSRPVFVHRLVALETIEEKIEMLKARKAGIAEAVFDHEGAPTDALTETDLLALLG